jgi:RNA polymerase sigma-54 factor
MGQKKRGCVEQRPQLHQRQKLHLSQALHRSLQILQLSQLELKDLLEEELDKNPLLERIPQSAARTSSISFQDPPLHASLHETLITQIKEAFENETEKKLAEVLCAHLDEQGFLMHDVETLAALYVTSLANMKKILTQLQTFSPAGIFARNLQEAFLLQLERQGLKKSAVYKLVLSSFADLLQKRYQILRKHHSLSSEELQTAIQILSRLSSRPLSLFQLSPEQPLYPDLRAQKNSSRQWHIELVEELLPRFRLQEKYLHLSDLSTADKRSLRTFTISAKWLIRSMERRRNLLLSLTSTLIRKQTRYFNGTGPLISLSAAKLAEELGVHESTISRALNEKYVETPRGIFSLKALCPLANDSVKEQLRQLVAEENPTAPWTDEELSKEMEKRGCKVARRTIAKYRKELHISPSSTRKHLL